MNSILFSKTAAKTVRKLPKNIQKLIQEAILELAKDPFRWTILADPFRKLQIRSGHATTSGGQYRIAYQFKPTEKQIIVVFIGPREGYYERLRKLIEG